MQKYLIVLVLCMSSFFNVCSVLLAGSGLDYQTQVYNTANEWNNNHTQYHDGGNSGSPWYYTENLRFTLSGGAYVRIWHSNSGCVYSCSNFDMTGVGSSLSSSYEQAFVGYNGTFASGNTTIDSPINAVNPSAIQVSDNAHMIGWPYIFLEFPGNNTGASWAGYCLNVENSNVYWVGFGDAYSDKYDLPPELGGATPTPSPTPSPTPTPTAPPPTPTPTPTAPPPTPTPWPVPSATVVPDVDVGGIDGNFTFDAESGNGTITVRITQDVEMVTLPDDIYDVGTGTASQGIPLHEGGETDDLTQAAESYLAIGSSTVNDVGDSYFKPLVDSILDTIMNHPAMAYFNDIEFDLTDDFCELTVTLFGSDITIGFCDLTDELAVLRLIIIGVAGVYSVFIVLKGD